MLKWEQGVERKESYIPSFFYFVIKLKEGKEGSNEKMNQYLITTTTCNCLQGGKAWCQIYECRYQYTTITTETATPTIELPKYFSDIPYLIYIIGGFIIFIAIILFVDMLRRSIR